jgi:serine/threonine-protein kinase
MFKEGDVCGGHYEIIGQLGAGGMGTVFQAMDTHLKRKVALKFAHADLLEQEEYRQRFWIEGRVLASLSHPNIVSVYTLEIEEKSKAPFLVMEYVPGKSLTTCLQENEKKTRLLSYFLETLHGIDACHKNGIIHRDIKPENILILPHGLKIVDFGLAKTDVKLTKTGATFGTATYMSPEQCLGTSNLTGASDVYALGIILWELLVGVSPFQADANSENSYMALVMMHLNNLPPFERLEKDPLARLFIGILGRMLDKKPEQRPPIDEIAAFLEQILKTYQDPADQAAEALPLNLDVQITLAGLRKGRR